VHSVEGRPGRPPGTSRTRDGLTERQHRIVDFVAAAVRDSGYSPSMREIGKAVGLSSTSSVAHQVKALEARGVLGRDPRRPRTFRLARDAHTETETEVAVEGYDGQAVNVPLVGRIAAGVPITAEQHHEDVLVLPRRLVGDGDLFALKVVGSSMTGAGIFDGDTVVVRAQRTADSGDIVAAMIDGEATVKRLRCTPPNVWLMPENPAFQPISATEALILGRVVAVLRAL